MNISYFWDLLLRYVPVEKVVTDHIRLLLAGFGSRPAVGCSVSLPSSSVHLGGIKKIPKVPGKITIVDKTVP